MIKSIKRLKYALARDLSPSDLSTILRGMNTEFQIDERMNALQNLMSWIRLPTKPTSEDIEVTHLHSRNVRFKFLMQFLERNPEEAKYFIETLREILGRGVAIRLYYLTGVSENTGFISEFTDRVIQKMLPHVIGERDLAEIFRLIFTELEDAEWFEQCYKTILPPLWDLIKKYQINLDGLVSDQDEALVILGSQIASLGVTKAIRTRLDDQKLSQSSFINLSKILISKTESDSAVLQEVSLCQINLQKVKKKLEATGVSVDLIYTLERIKSLLQRVEMIIYLRQTNDPETKNIIISRFIGRLIRDEIARLSLGQFLKENIKMLTKKIVERAGEKGDHYIASTKDEKKHLFRAACWAGVLTAFTAILKVLIGHAGFSLFFEGLFYFVNYAIGFLLMQKWHLALSSKQPAFTASALSKKFEDFIQTKQLAEVTAEVRKISYSQFIATIGNLLYVIPVAMALDWLCFYILGHHIVSAEYAQTLIDKHHPFMSGTIIYAAFTGVLLWLSSIVAGAVENWVVFRNIPQMLKESSFLNNFLGKERARHWSDSFPSMIGAASGNLSIAFFLATPIIFGKITGIPLDIRHVTLATGTITLSLNALPWTLELLPTVGIMLFSILLMGTLNFGISFFCAIKLAATARDVDSKYLKIIFKYAFKKPQEKATRSDQH